MEFTEIIGVDQPGFLGGQFLLAMPGMNDPRFEKAVILLAGHSERGALGFVVNQPADLTMSEMYEKVGIDADDVTSERSDETTSVMRGGPVESSRGFVLHSNDYVSSSTMKLNDTVSLTTTLDILKAMAMGVGPERAMLTIGYAAWDEGQLENELLENVWLTTTADIDLMFDVPADERYAAAFRDMGVPLEALSGVAGTA